MKINYDNLSTAIKALERCAKENKDKQIDTGAIRISDLCRDVAEFLAAVKAERDVPHTKVRLRKIQSQRMFTKTFLSQMHVDMKALNDVCAQMFARKLADSNLVEVKEGTDPVTGNHTVTMSMFVGVKENVEIKGFDEA